MIHHFDRGPSRPERKFGRGLQDARFSKPPPRTCPERAKRVERVPPLRPFGPPVGMTENGSRAPPPHAARIRTRLLAADGRGDSTPPASGHGPASTRPSFPANDHESLPAASSREEPPSTLLALIVVPASAAAHPTMLKMAPPPHAAHPPRVLECSLTGVGGWEFKIQNSTFQLSRFVLEFGPCES